MDDDMRTVWIPEHPSLPLYRAAVPRPVGKLGERQDLLTASVWDALQFDTRAECDAWVAANPHPPFVTRDHGLLRPMHVEVDEE